MLLKVELEATTYGFPEEFCKILQKIKSIRAKMNFLEKKNLIVRQIITKMVLTASKIKST